MKLAHIPCKSFIVVLTSKRLVCCNFGTGSVGVFLGTPSDETLLAFVDGTFADQATRAFVANPGGFIQRQVILPSPAAADNVPAPPAAIPTFGADATPTPELAGKVTNFNTTSSETDSLSSSSRPPPNGTSLPSSASGNCDRRGYYLGGYSWFLAVSLNIYLLNWYN